MGERGVDVDKMAATISATWRKIDALTYKALIRENKQKSTTIIEQSGVRKNIWYSSEKRNIIKNVNQNISLAISESLESTAFITPGWLDTARYSQKTEIKHRLV